MTMEEGREYADYGGRKLWESMLTMEVGGYGGVCWLWRKTWGSKLVWRRAWGSMLTMEEGMGEYADYGGGQGGVFWLWRRVWRDSGWIKSGAQDDKLFWMKEGQDFESKQGLRWQMERHLHSYWVSIRSFGLGILFVFLRFVTYSYYIRFN